MQGGKNTSQGLFGEEGCLFFEAIKVVIPSTVLTLPPCWSLFLIGTSLLPEIRIIWSLLTLF